MLFRSVRALPTQSPPSLALLVSLLPDSMRPGPEVPLPHRDTAALGAQAQIPGLSSLERSIARQCSHLCWLKDFVALSKIQALHHVHKKRIMDLSVDGMHVSDEAGLPKAALDHFSTLLGSHARGTSLSILTPSAPSSVRPLRA